MKRSDWWIHSWFVFLLILVFARFNRVVGFLPENLWRWAWAGIVLMIIVFWVLLSISRRMLVRQRANQLAHALTVLTISFLYLDTFGTIFGWYSSHPRYDQIVHFMSGVTLAVWISGIWPFRWRAGAAIGLTVAVAIAFELGEMLVDWMFAVEYWLGSADDTASDILLGFAGAALAVVALHVLRIKLPDGSIQKSRQAYPRKVWQEQYPR